ncbi:MAG: hypothetical protein Sapg2KO_19380 [Saprospiraceae bacterium]
MNRFLALIVFLSASISIHAQAPQAFAYQAVLRSADGQIRSDQNITIEIQILKDSPMGNPVYTESQNVTTNALGLINITVGEGMTMDNLNTIDWSNGSYFMQTSVDGTVFGTSQLLSVPYALYAENAGNTFSGDYNDLSNVPAVTESDPVFSAAAAKNITDAGSGQVITESERDQLNDAIVPLGAVQNGNLLTYDGNNWIAQDLLTGNTGGSQAFSIVQPYQSINYIIALVGLFPSRSGAEPFIGEISMFGGNFAPRGWAFCNGQLLPIAQNTALFSLLGTTYGGDGRTTFGLPDLRGRVPVHFGNGPGLSDYRLGQKGGAERMILNVTQIPSHNHTVKGN